MTAEELTEELKQAIRPIIEKAGEHCTTLHVFATRDDEVVLPNGKRRMISANLSLGSGSWYARFGQISMWVDAERAAFCSQVEEEMSSAPEDQE